MSVFATLTIVDGAPTMRLHETLKAAQLCRELHYRALWPSVMDDEPFPEDAGVAHGILVGENVDDDELMWLHTVHSPIKPAMPAKLWTLTIEDRSGTTTSIYTSEAEADAAALAWCKAVWFEDDGPMPDNWSDARDVINEWADQDSLRYEEHRFDVPPLSAPEVPLRANDRPSWLSTVWAALHDLEAMRGTDEGMDDVKSAMAYITEALGADQDETVDQYREAARTKWEEEGECEIDDLAVVSVSEDGGAYVQAWVWVSNEDAGIKDLGSCADCGQPAVDEWNDETNLCRDCHMQRQDEEHIQ